MLRRLIHGGFWRIWTPVLSSLAFVWRTLLFRTTFIAITGSLGKTTAKECLGAILSERDATYRTVANHNDAYGVAHSIVRVRPWHRFAVMEAATGAPGAMIRQSRLLRPDIAVILGVARTHQKEMRTLEATAAEKAQLLTYLNPNGTAILNGDDKRVRPMAGQAPGKVLFFGSTPDCDVRLNNARSQWPSRLELSVTAGGETFEVETNLLGTHWSPSVLAALTAARVCGVPVAHAARVAKSVQPFPGRMHPNVLPSGAVMIRDEFNGSIDSLTAAIEVLRNADAKRRLLVISDCSDFKMKPRDRVRYYARLASECADGVIFIGDRAGRGALHAVNLGLPAENVRSFHDLRPAAEFLRSELRIGDLVLLRGRATEHLSRLCLAQFGDVDCWRPNCSRRHLCDTCPQLGLVPTSELAAK